MKKHGFLLILAIFLLPTLAQASNQPIRGADILAKTKSEITNVNTDELKAILAKEPLTLLVDVRNPTEIYQMGGTIDKGNNHNIPRGWLELRIEERTPDKNTPIIVYCGTNQRSPLAAKTLMNMGYTNVKNYSAGALEWVKLGLPALKLDRATTNFLYRMPEKVTEGVYSAIGATAPGTYDNNGHNNNLSFIIGKKSVLVFNAGDNYLLAKALHDEIKKKTDKPVKYLVLENGQGHAMLGSNYWKEQGATIIAHKLTAEKIEEYGDRILDRMRRLRRDKGYKTEIVAPDITFEDGYTIDLDGEKVELLYYGEAHEPDDIALWMPSRELLIMGDLGFHQRLLPIMADTNVNEWIGMWPKLVGLGAKHIIPGHGDPVKDMAEITKYTHDYLFYMRKNMREIIAKDGTLNDAYKVDQTPYMKLHTYHQLYLQNASRLFQALEFE